MLKLKSKPRNQLKDRQRRVRQGCRSTERQTRDVEREEQNVQESIKEDARRSALTTSVKALGEDFFGLKGSVNHLHEHKSLTSTTMHLGESVANAENIGHSRKNSDVLKVFSNLKKAPTVNHSYKVNLDESFQIDPQNRAKPFSSRLCAAYNKSMKASSRDGNVEEVLRLFTRMEEDRCKPNVLCYNTVLNCLVMAKRFEKVTEVFDKMIALKIYPNVSTYNILVKLYSCYKDQFDDEALKIFESMPKRGCNPDVTTYSTLITGLSRAGRFVEADDLICTMLNKKYYPNVYTYTPVLQGLCAKGKIKDAKQYIELMWRRGCPPNSVTYNILLDALCKFGNFDEVESILEESESKGWKPNAISYNTVMNSLCKAFKEQKNSFYKIDKLFTVLKLLTDMLKKGVFPNTGSYNIVVHSLCEAGMPLTAKRMVQSRGFAVDVVTYNTLIDGFYRVRDFKEVEHLYHKMTTVDNINPDMFTYTILIDMYSTQGEVLEAKRLFQECVRMGFSPDLVMYGALINGCLKKRELDLGLKVFGRMWEQGLVPNFIIFDSLIRACCGELNKSHVCNTIDKVLGKR